MQYLNIHSSTLDSAEFLGASAGEQSTWIKLLRFCIGQENGGRIAGARGFSDKKWSILVRVRARDVQKVSTLWEVRGDDLIVAFYPTEQEREIRAKRIGAAISNAKRWGTAPVSTLAQNPAERNAEPVAERHAEQCAERLRKGMEGKGKEGEGEGKQSTTTHTSS